jgi:hypothetical protein
MKRAAVLAMLIVFGVTSRAAAEHGTPGHVDSGKPTTRGTITWLFGDDDALHAASDVRPASPAASVGDRAGFDGLGTGLDSRFTGRENQLVLGVTALAPGFFPGVSTRAELALGVELGSVGARPAPLMAEDRGSELGLELALGAGGGAPTFGLRLLPLNADRLRVGWLEVLAWGGEVGPRRDSPYASARTPPRGAALDLDAGPFRAELGLKTANFLEPVPGGPAVEEASYGVHAVLEVRSGPIALGAAVGRFEHGRVEGARHPPRAITTGASVRASLGVGIAASRAPFGLGLEPSTSIVENDDRSGWVVGVEAATLVERLRSFEQPGRTVLAPARAIAVAGTVRAGPVEARALVTIREPAFVMRSVPGVFDGLTLPAESVTQSDILGLVSAMIRVRPWLEPGLSFGVRSPAAVMTASLDALGQPVGATVVAYAPGDVELLPLAEGPVPVLETTVSLGLRASQLLGAVAFAGYRRDHNRARLEQMPGGAVARAFTDPNRLLYGIAVRAAW